MTYSADQVITELKVLRKGLGIETDDIGSHVGPALRWLSGIEDGDGGALVRDKVREHLHRTIGQCHQDQQMLLLAAFGLEESAAPRRYQQRIKEIADLAFVDLRTMQRRVDSGLRRIAELAVELVEAPDHVLPARLPWHTTRLLVAINFDLAVPEVFETRRVVAEQNDVSEVEIGMTLTPPPGWTGSGLEELGVDLIYGGELLDRAMKARNRVGFTLRLPTPLSRGEEHEYAFRVKLPVERGIAPHYVCTPRYRCDRFELRVRFGASRVPERAWRLAGVPPLELDDPVWTHDGMTPDRCGEMHAVFENLEPQLSYGVGWSNGVPDSGWE